MKHLQSQIRHSLTCLAGLGGFIGTHIILTPDQVAAVDGAGAELIEPLSIIIGVIFAALARMGIALIGKKFPAIGERLAEMASGGMSGGRYCLLLLCTMAGLGFLPSCTSLSDVPVAGQFFYRDPGSGAKGGIQFSPGAPARGFLRVPIYDSETGALIGFADVETATRAPQATP